MCRPSLAKRTGATDGSRRQQMLVPYKQEVARSSRAPPILPGSLLPRNVRCPQQPNPMGESGAWKPWSADRDHEFKVGPSHHAGAPRYTEVAPCTQRGVAPLVAPPQTSRLPPGYRMIRNVRRTSSALNSLILTSPRAARYLPVPPVMAKEYGVCLNSSPGP